MFKSIVRFIGIYLLIGIAQLFCFLSPFGLAIDKLFKKLKVNKFFNPFWFTIDDTRLDSSRKSGLASDYEVFLNDYKNKTWGMLIWHIKRNRSWNFVELFKVPKQTPEVGNQDIEVIKFFYDELYQLDDKDLPIKVEQDGPWAIGAGLKFVPEPGEDPYQKNRGDVINRETTILGKGGILYKIGKWKGFRFTSCKEVRVLGKKYWRTIYIGTNSSRYAIKFKHQALKPWN